MRHIATFVVLLLVVRQADALPIDSTWNVDIGSGTAISAPSSAFGSVPGIASPGGLRYDPVSGSTMMMAVLGADLPLGDGLRFGARASYTASQHRHAALERAPIAAEGGSVVTATMRHDLQGTFRMLGIEPYVRYDPTSWLAITAGLPVMSVVTSRYAQALSFVDPPGVRFLDGSVEQITARGDVPNLRTVFPMISLSAEGMIPASVSGSIMLVPRLSFARSLQSFTRDGAFNAQVLTASIGLRYRFPSTVPETSSEPPPAQPLAVPRPANPVPLAVRIERDTFVELTRGLSEAATYLVGTVVDTIDVQSGDTTVRAERRRETYRMALPKPPSVLRAALQLQFVDDAGAVTDNARLSAVRIEARRIISFLPAVVFDGDSEELPQRYRQLSAQDAKSWKESSLAGATSPHWQYHVLNIIGSRMRKSRSSRCTLVGHATAERRLLTERRVDQVREYLISRFGITKDRLDVDVRIDAGGTSALNTVLIMEAGRDLLMPVEYSTTFIETRLPRLHLIPDVISEAGLTSWTIDATQGETRVRSFADKGSVPATITWDMNDDIGADAAFRQPVLLTLRVTDADETESSSQPVKVSLTSRMPLASASRPVKRTEIFTLGRADDARQSAPQPRQKAPLQRQLAEWTTLGLELPERRLYEESGMNLAVQLLERR